MLRHYVESDMRDVVRDLNDSGYGFQFEWLKPFFGVPLKDSNEYPYTLDLRHPL